MKTLVATWTAQAAQMREDAEKLRSNGMYESARGLRLKADQLTDCAAELQRACAAAEATATNHQDGLQTDCPPMPHSHLPTPSVPHNESAAIRDLQTLLTLAPPSTLLPHPRLLAMKRAVQRGGSAALEGILTLRIASLASNLTGTCAGPHAPEPADAEPQAPMTPAPACDAATHPEPDTAAAIGEPQSLTHLPVLPKSSADGSHADTDASAV